MIFKILSRISLACALLATLPDAKAETFPSRAIKFIVPFSAGSAPDLMARAVGNKVAERLGQPVVVENRVGAAGQIGLNATAQSAPDGYTLGVGAVTNLALAPHAYRKLPYDPLKSFVPVGQATTNYFALVVRPDAAFKTAPEMVRWAKENPGKLKVGTSGVGGHPHFALESLARMAGFTFLNVPYQGDARVLADLMSGILDASFGTYTVAAPLIDAGSVLLLGISSPTRDPHAPGRQAIAEFVHGYEALGWFGFVAPAHTPAETVMKLNEEINRALGQPDVQASMRSIGLTPATGSPEQFERLIRSEYGKFEELVRAVQFQPQ